MENGEEIKGANPGRKKENLGSFDGLDFDAVECSKEIYKRLIWEEGKGKSILAVVIFFISLIYTINTEYPYLPFFTFLFLAGYFSFLQWKAQRMFFKQFAEQNNLSYKSSGNISQVTGNLFKVGHSRKIRNLITGRYGQNKANFFHYSYAVGQGKYQTIFNFTVLEVFFDEINFPHILLQTRNKGIFWGKRHGKKGIDERGIALESEFNDYFKLFFHDGYGVEATQIFSEDFLRFLKEEKSYFDIELKEDRLYVYDSTRVRRKREFEELFEVAGKVINKISPVLERLDNDFAALNEYYK